MIILDYLKNPTLFHEEAQVLELRLTENGPALLLDRTIFYPQGGGQPADQGQISSPNGIFVVGNVRLDETGVVHHFGHFIRGQFKKGETVKLEIDQPRRLLNTRVHSAGHLIDQAFLSLLDRNLKPIKSYHFPDGPYIEYEGTLNNPETYIAPLEKAVQSLVAQKVPLEIQELSPAEAQKEGYEAPPGKSVRIVKFQSGIPRGCGGTHVKHSAEIGPITIRKISSKKGVVKVAYTV